MFGIKKFNRADIKKDEIRKATAAEFRETVLGDTCDELVSFPMCDSCVESALHGTTSIVSTDLKRYISNSLYVHRGGWCHCHLCGHGASSSVYLSFVECTRLRHGLGFAFEYGRHNRFRFGSFSMSKFALADTNRVSQVLGSPGKRHSVSGLARLGSLGNRRLPRK